MPARFPMIERLGNTLAVGGSILSIVGALVNNLWLSHTVAMWIWAISNPLFLAYFVGVDMKWWDGQHISTRALIVTYIIFTVSNILGLFHT
jgi:hypothetical protein